MCNDINEPSEIIKNNQYLPMKVGNNWTYIDTVFAETLTVYIDVEEMCGNNNYYRFNNFPFQYLRNTEDELFVFQSKDFLFLDFKKNSFSVRLVSDTFTVVLEN